MRRAGTRDPSAACGVAAQRKQRGGRQRRRQRRSEANAETRGDAGRLLPVLEPFGL